MKLSLLASIKFLYVFTFLQYMIMAMILKNEMNVPIVGIIPASDKTAIVIPEL